MFYFFKNGVIFKPFDDDKKVYKTRIENLKVLLTKKFIPAATKELIKKDLKECEQKLR